MRICYLFPENGFQEPQVCLGKKNDIFCSTASHLVSGMVTISIVSKLVFNLGHDYGSPNVLLGE